MASKLETVGWTLAFAVVLALSIPWFMWRDSAVVAGLPVWLWWHIGWMGVACVVFAAFAKRAWGLGIETEVSHSR